MGIRVENQKSISWEKVKPKKAQVGRRKKGLTIGFKRGESSQKRRSKGVGPLETHRKSGRGGERQSSKESFGEGSTTEQATGVAKWIKVCIKRKKSMFVWGGKKNL